MRNVITNRLQLTKFKNTPRIEKYSLKKFAIFDDSSWKDTTKLQGLICAKMLPSLASNAGKITVILFSVKLFLLAFKVGTVVDIICRMLIYCK